MNVRALSGGIVSSVGSTVAYAIIGGVIFGFPGSLPAFSDRLSNRGSPRRAALY